MPIDVMLVDDSSAIRKMIRRVLDITGLDLGRVEEAANGREALEKLAGLPVDIVLTDINMPEMDGEVFVRHLREDARLGAIPVVVVSTDSTSLRRQRLESLGAQGYLSKPFTPEKLRDELERVLGQCCTDAFTQENTFGNPGGSDADCDF
jgi:two-component system chemotaxis response regulator CheY